MESMNSNIDFFNYLFSKPVIKEIIDYVIEKAKSYTSAANVQRLQTLLMT